jgi:hypothetical protein
MRHNGSSERQSREKRAVDRANRVQKMQESIAQNPARSKLAFSLLVNEIVNNSDELLVRQSDLSWLLAIDLGKTSFKGHLMQRLWAMP